MVRILSAHVPGWAHPNQGYYKGSAHPDPASKYVVVACHVHFRGWMCPDPVFKYAEATLNLTCALTRKRWML